MSTNSQPSFSSSTWKRGGVWMCKLGEDIMLLLSANRKSYMPRRLAQQRMILRYLEWLFHASRAISAVAELLVLLLYSSKCASGRVSFKKFPEVIPNRRMCGRSRLLPGRRSHAPHSLRLCAWGHAPRILGLTGSEAARSRLCATRVKCPPLCRSSTISPTP